VPKIYLEDYINKIVLLEKLVGAKTTYEILAPFSLDTNDTMAIQHAAKRIAEFVGLKGITFVVGIAKEEDGVGGHIELELGVNTLYIEISKEMKQYHDAVPAVLAHEITHKYLQLNGISCGSGPFYQFENEILTDITAVFLGLGKLLLNGCECNNIREEHSREGTRTIKETMKVGYLDRSQMAFVYRFVSAMRYIHPKVYELKLSTDSIQALRQCESEYGYYFSERFKGHNTGNCLVEKTNPAIRSTQLILSRIDRDLSYFRNSCIKTTDTFLENTHKRLNAIATEYSKISKDNEYDPCLRFIGNLQADQEATKLMSEIKELASKANEFESEILKLANLLQTLKPPFSQPQPEMFNTVICHNDGTKFRLPEGKFNLTVSCPKCGYVFIADTSIPTYTKSSGKKA